MKNIICSLVVMSMVLPLLFSCSKGEKDLKEKSPELITIIPVSGMSGCKAIISGNNFSPVPGENLVSFGGVEALVEEAAETRLVVRVPEHEDGKVELKVVTDGYELKGLSFTYVTMEDLDIAVNSVMPSEGFAGEIININGENFSDDRMDLRVTFDGVDVPVVSNNGMNITVVAPEHQLGVAEIKVYSKSKSAVGEFKYVELGISGNVPSRGIVGTVVTISGEGFSGTASENVVRLGDVECEISSATLNTLQVVIPEMPMGTYTFSVDAKNRHTEGGSFEYPETWTVETIAGSVTRGHKNGFGIAARFQFPQNIVADSDGLLWITQRGGAGKDAIRTMDPDTYEVKTVVSGGVIDGSHPWGSCFDKDGNLWFVGKATGKLFRLAKNSTEAEEIVLPAHKLETNPMSVLVDDAGKVYLLNRGNESYISIFSFGTEWVKENDYSVKFMAQTMVWNKDKSRIIIGTNGSPFGIHLFNPSDGTISRIAGNGAKPTADTYSDGTAGNPATAVIGAVFGMALDKDGALLFNDNTSYTLRKLVPGDGGDYAKGTVKTLAGTPMVKGNTDGLGEAKFDVLAGIISMPDGSIIISSDVGTIRRIHSNQ